MNHIFNLINLSADTTYQVKAKSYDEVMCDYMVSDDPSNPQEFTTLSAQQPVINSITVTAAKQRIAVGESMDIIAKCLDLSGAPVKGISVEFSAAGALSWLFFWLPPIGSLNPLIAQTDTNGEAKTVFTAGRKGIAVIKAKAGNIENKVMVVIG